MSLLGLDVGMTRTIAAAYSVEGERLARTVATYRPAPDVAGTLELDVQQVWQGVCEALRGVAVETDRDAITALAVCSTGEGLVGLDSEGRPLGRCLVTVRTPGSPARGSTGAMDDPRFFEIAGRLPDEHDALALLSWLRERRAEQFWRAWRFVPLGVFVGSALGGAVVCDPSQAARALPLHVARRAWSQELLTSHRLPRRLLPDLQPAGTPIGAVAGRVASEVGLGKGVRVILGAQELACQALGAGVHGSGPALLDLGASLRMGATFQAIPLTALMLAEGLGMAPHAVEGLLLSVWESPHGERTLRWFRDHLAPLEKREAQRSGMGVYDLLLSEMPARPTSLLALPGCDSDDGGDGAPGGGALLGVDYDTTRGEIVRAILEGVTLQALGALRRYERAGVRVDEVRAVGGGAASDRWLQIVADVLGMPVRRPGAHDSGTLGAALLAGLGSGAYATPGEAVGAAVRYEVCLEPNPDDHEAYRERAELADEARGRLGDLAGSLAGLRRPGL